MESDWNVKRKISSYKTVRETSEIKFANFILEHSSQWNRISIVNRSAFRHNITYAWLIKYFCFLLYVSAMYWKPITIISVSYSELYSIFKQYRISPEEISCWKKKNHWELLALSIYNWFMLLRRNRLLNVPAVSVLAQSRN